MNYIRGYNFNYAGSKKHQYRDAFLRMIRRITHPLLEIGLIMLILKLCHVVDISYIAILGFFWAWLIGDWLLDILDILIAKIDEKIERREWEAMFDVQRRGKKDCPGGESGDQGESDSYSGYGEAD